MNIIRWFQRRTTLLIWCISIGNIDYEPCVSLIYVSIILWNKHYNHRFLKKKKKNIIIIVSLTCPTRFNQSSSTSSNARAFTWRTCASFSGGRRGTAGDSEEIADDELDTRVLDHVCDGIHQEEVSCVEVELVCSKEQFHQLLGGAERRRRRHEHQWRTAPSPSLSQ